MVLLFRLLHKGLGKEVAEGFSLGPRLIEAIFFFMVWDFFWVFTVQFKAPLWRIFFSFDFFQPKVFFYLLHKEFGFNR